MSRLNKVIPEWPAEGLCFARCSDIMAGSIMSTVMKIVVVGRLGTLAVLAAIVGLAGGCATKKPLSKNYTVFPPPPDEPRIQYLMSYGSETDLGGHGGFNAFVTGKEKVFRPIWKPYGVAINKGKVYVCDTQAANVSIADLTRHKLVYLKPDGQEAMRLPINVAVDNDGNCYVTDVGRGQVLIYKDKNLVGQIGKKGEMKPCGIALAGERLYVTDMTNRCVRVYNRASRELLLTVPRDCNDEKAKLFGPTNVAVDKQGRICVSDSSGFVVKIYDAEGNHLRTIGELGVTPGQFALPKGVGVDQEGRVYVLDAAAPVIQLFDSEGKLLMFFGQPGDSGPGGLYLPAGLTIDYDNVDLFQKYAAPGFKLEYLILVTNQVGPNKVSVYGFLRKA
jgi:DNA-binding beta-propeller fold protein YncE